MCYNSRNYFRGKIVYKYYIYVVLLLFSTGCQLLSEKGSNPSNPLQLDINQSYSVTIINFGNKFLQFSPAQNTQVHLQLLALNGGEVRYSIFENADFLNDQVISGSISPTNSSVDLGSLIKIKHTICDFPVFRVLRSLLNY